MSPEEGELYDEQGLLALAAGFAVAGRPVAVAPLGQGLINATFALDTEGGRYVLQRVNAAVFPEPEAIMANLGVLAEHLAGHLAQHPTSGPVRGIRIPAPIPRRDGATSARDAQGHLWRLMERVPDAANLPQLSTQAQAGQVGLALGQFHRLLADLDQTRLAVTLPGFHVTPDYLSQLDQNLADRPPAKADLDSDLDSDLAPDLDLALSEVDRRRPLAWALEGPRRAGVLPERVTHGDPKLDNILFHRGDGRALALIDLDTVQPGLIQHDLGDCLRSCCNRQGEGASREEAAAVGFDLELAAAILGAYARETRALLDPAEIDSLYDGIRVIPYELGVRFLADHLAGDRYFRVRARGENLTKALTQFALTADIERQEGAIRTLIRHAFA